jgi:hypothetical protein
MATLGRHHQALAEMYSGFIGCNDAQRERSALLHLCTHLDGTSRLLNDADALHTHIGDRSFRDRQRVVLGSSRQTLFDLHRNARCAVFHDRLDNLAETVDWYGRTVQAAQAGLQGWAAAHERDHLEGILGIVQDSGRPDLARCLLAYEAWTRHERAAEIPESLLEALQAEPDTSEATGPYRVLAAAILQLSGLSIPAWAIGLEPWRTLELRVQSPPDTGWSRRAWRALTEGDESPQDVGKALTEQNTSDWGRVVSTVLGHMEKHPLADEQVPRLVQFMHTLQSLDWMEIPIREALTAMGPGLRDCLLGADFDLVAFWRSFLERIRSDHRGAASGVIQHILRLSLDTSIQAATTELVIETAEAFPEVYYRARLIRECPGLLGCELTTGKRNRDWVYTNLKRLVAIEAASVPEVTSDNLMFGIGRAFGNRGDKESVHAAFARIRNPWIKGQLVRVQPAQHMAALELTELPASLSNPLAQRFALSSIFDVISPTCSLQELETGIRIAAACEPYPEVRIAGLEGVLSGLRHRSDRAAAMASLWEHHGELLDFDAGYRWRLLLLLVSGGVTPADCPEDLAVWISDSLQHFSDTQRGTLGAQLSGLEWHLEADEPDDIQAGARTTQLREALTADPPDLTVAEDVARDWSPAEWVLWVNSLEIAAHGGLASLAPTVAAYLADQVGPARVDPSSVFSLLDLVNTAGPGFEAQTTWNESHQPLLKLALQPDTFSPELQSKLPELECWHSVLDWMSRGVRSRTLVEWTHDPTVRGWLQAQQEWIGRSEYGRLYPIVKYPERNLLAWLTLMCIDGIRPAQMLVAEYLTRAATEKELAKLKNAWLGPEEEAS